MSISLGIGTPIGRNGKVTPVTPTPWVDLGQYPNIAAAVTAESRMVASLTPFNGRIYAGYGDTVSNEPSLGVTLVAWDETSQTFLPSIGTLESYADFRMRNLGGTLWVPGGDQINARGTQTVWATIDSGHNFVQTANGLPTVYHLMDITSFNGHTLMCGSKYVSGVCSLGVVWRFNGSTWDEKIVMGTCGDGLDRRIYGFCRTGDGKIYARSTNVVTTYESSDGLNWTAAVAAANPQIAATTLFTGTVTMYRGTHRPPGTAVSVSRYGPTSLFGSNIGLPAPGAVDMCLDNENRPWYLCPSMIYRSIDTGASAFTSFVAPPANASAICVTDQYIYVGTTDSHLWRKAR